MAEVPIVRRIGPEDVTDALARQVVELGMRVWPQDVGTLESGMAWFRERSLIHSDSERMQALTYCYFEDAALLAKAHTFGRVIRTPTGRLAVLALAGVCTDPRRRGEGLGALVVRAAFERVDNHTLPVSLFQTRTHVQPFYEKLDCRRVHNRFVNSLADDPQADPFWDDIAMIYPAEYNWPQGEIDLVGPGY